MDHWKKQMEAYAQSANDMRALADRSSDAALKQSFLKLAEDYDSLAQKAARAHELEIHYRNQQIDKQTG